MAEVPKDGESDCSFEDRRERNRDEKKDANVNVSITAMSRKEKRKALKKMKRKQLRREKAMKEREEEEARLNNPEELMRLQRLEQEEAERMERDRMAFEERERKFLEALELKKKREQEEEEQRRKLSEESQSKLVENENASKADEDDDWEYVEEGPAEIIWKGNEIIVKKKKVRVPKKSLEIENTKQESERPISNPLAPQSEAFEDYKSAQEVLESVAQQVPNFGTEQDKAHCPFHLKTGVCRFGARCSRVHFYPDKACTLLMKNMYSGPGLAWEQDEGLEYTEDEVEQSFEEFYEDVHTEFLKFGEIVNFKVCKNSSSHLRGNVYVHYKSLESAVLACQSINGRYFAGKQISCEFVNVTRWKVAICGEYMKSRLKTCSRGSACNFIHCFRNPGGDYEWADWDKPAPGYWLKKMAALFGYPADRLTGEVSPRYGSRRSRSRGPNSAHGRSHSDEDVDWKRERHRRHRERSKERTANPDEEMHEEKMSSVRYHHSKRRRHDTFGTSDGSSDEQRSDACRKRSRKRERDPEIAREDRKIRQHEADSGKPVKRGESERYHEHDRGKRRKRGEELDVDRHSRGNVGEVDPRENSDTDGHHDRYRRHKSRHSPDKKKDSNSSDIDSHGVRLDRDKHRHHSRSKRSSRHMKNESDTSDSASIEDVGRERRRREKNGRNSRSRNESYFMDIESSQERLSRDDRSSGHRRRNSRHHNEESELSNAIFNAQKYHRGRDSPEEDNLTESQNYGNHGKRSSQDVASNKSFEAEEDNGNYDVGNRQEINERKEEATPSQTVEASGSHSSSLETNRESESERELAYRLAPLKKLEEMRKSKDPQPAHGIHGNVAAVGGDEDASKDSKQQCSVSSKVEPSTASTRRRRI